MYLRKQPLNPLEGPVKPPIIHRPPEFKDSGKYWKVDVGRIMSEQEENPMTYTSVLAVAHDENVTRNGQKSFTPKVNKAFRPPYRNPDLENPLTRMKRPNTQFINYSVYPNLYPVNYPARMYERAMTQNGGTILDTPIIKSTNLDIQQNCLMNSNADMDLHRSVPGHDVYLNPEIPVEQFTYIPEVELEFHNPQIRDYKTQMYNPNDSVTQMSRNGNPITKMSDLRLRNPTNVKASQTAKVETIVEMPSKPLHYNLPQTSAVSGVKTIMYDQNIEEPYQYTSVARRQELKLGHVDAMHSAPYKNETIQYNPTFSESNIREHSLPSSSYNNNTGFTDISTPSYTQPRNVEKLKQRIGSTKGYLPQANYPSTSMAPVYNTHGKIMI